MRTNLSAKHITQSIKSFLNTSITGGGANITKASKAKQILLTACSRCTIGGDVTKEDLRKHWV